MARIALAAALGLASAAGVSAAAEARLEGGPWLPYRVNRAILAADSTISGLVELRAKLWDGSARLLFRARADARTRSMPIAFYVDEEMKSLELSMGGGAWAEAAPIEASPPEEAAAMRALVPPQRLAAGRNAPAALSLDGAVAAQAGARIASRLFVPEPPVLALGILAASAVAAVAAAALPRKAGRRGAAAIALAACAALAGAAGAAAAATPPPTLYSAALPLAGPSTRLWGTLARSSSEGDGWRRVECLPADSRGGDSAGRLLLLGIASGAGRGVPLEALGDPAAPIRLSAPPLIESRYGAFFVESGSFVTGWSIHGR